MSYPTLLFTALAASSLPSVALSNDAQEGDADDAYPLELVVDVNLGIHHPTGAPALVAEVHALPFFALGAGMGVGSAGAQLAAYVRPRLPLPKGFALGVDAGLSTGAYDSTVAECGIADGRCMIVDSECMGEDVPVHGRPNFDLVHGGVAVGHSL